MSSFFPRWVNSAFAALKCGEEAVGEKLPLPDSELFGGAMLLLAKKPSACQALKLREVAVEGESGIRKAISRHAVKRDG